METLNRRESLTKSLVKISHDELKVTLQEINPPQISDILNSIQNKKLEHSKTPQHIKRSNKNYSIDTRLSTISSYQEGSNIKKSNAHQNAINNFFENQKDQLNLGVNEKKTLSSELGIEWDENFEKKFMDFMSKGRSLFSHEMKSSRFYEVGVMNMIQELLKEERNHLERDSLLGKYADGNFLTAEELKFMSDTSDLLNSCIDKSYVRRVVNLLDPNILNYVNEIFFKFLIFSLDRAQFSRVNHKQAQKNEKYRCNGEK